MVPGYPRALPRPEAGRSAAQRLNLSVKAFPVRSRGEIRSRSAIKHCKLAGRVDGEGDGTGVLARTRQPKIPAKALF
jgi:hypothetical protein